MTIDDIASLAYDRYRLAIVQANSRANKMPCRGCSYDELMAQTKVEELPPYRELVAYVAGLLAGPDEEAT